MAQIFHFYKITENTLFCSKSDRKRAQNMQFKKAIFQKYIPTIQYTHSKYLLQMLSISICKTQSSTSFQLHWSYTSEERSE